MKNKFTFQSAFFYLRVLICLSVALAGVFLALLGLGGLCSRASTDASANTNTYLYANGNTDAEASSNTQTPSDSPAASTQVRNAVD